MSFYQKPEHIEEEIDFHFLGNNTSLQSIEDYLFDALAELKENNIKKVRLIVGRGLHSPDGPVLPDRVCRVLNQFQEKGRIKNHYFEPSIEERSGSIIVEI